jgi:hypothetical protein
MRHVRAEACVHVCARGRVCVRGRARIRANACQHFTQPLSVAFSARRRSSRRRRSTRTSARGTPPPSLHCPTYAPLPARRAPRRIALGRSPTHARPLCAAAPPMCARARVCVCAHVAMCIRVYVDGSSMYSHLCPSAIELALHSGLPMSNALTHRPFPRCMYTHIRLLRLHHARVRVCVGECVYGGALHVCKLRRSVKIPARVLYSCVHCHAVQMSISLYVCADRPCSHPPLHTRARVRGHELRARVSRPRVYLTRHPCVRYL